MYRQTLRRFERANVHQSVGRRPFAWIKGLVNQTRVRLARRRRDFRKVIECGELVLVTKPSDRRAHLQMAEAAEKLGLLDVAIWLLEQIWDKRSSTTTLNRTLARLYERRREFMKASILWDLVRRANPDDLEAHHKMQSLAAQDTIARGQYVEAVQELDDG